LVFKQLPINLFMKKITLLVGILAVIGIGIGVMMYNKPHQNIKSAKADVSINAAELFAAYETDEAAANAQYLDKMIEVKGKVVEVKEGEDGNIGVTLDGGGMMFGVICELDNLTDHKRTEFPVGEEVTFKGICTGMLMDVVLVRCVEM
jgi:hypothetical protein